MTNKFLLAAIAFGLWANAAVSYVRPASADDASFVGGLGGIEGQLAVIAQHVGGIENFLRDQQVPAIIPARP